MRWIGNNLSPIGLDVGSRYVKAAQVRHIHGNVRVQAFARIARVSEKIDANEVARITEILSRQGFAGRQVRLGVPPAKLLNSILELPPRTAGAPFEQLALAEFARNQKCEPGSFEMASWDLPQPARATKTTNLMAVGCRCADAEGLLSPFDVVGLDVLGLDSPSCAAARACARFIGDIAGIWAILDLGWAGAGLIILYQNAIIYDRWLGEAGIKQLYNRLSQSRDMNFAAIDALITHAPSAEGEAADGPQKELAHAMDQHFSSLLKDLELSFSYASSHYGGNVERLLVIGGGGSVPGLIQRWSKHLPTQTQVLTPADVADLSTVGSAKNDSAMITALGLALGSEHES